MGNVATTQYTPAHTGWRWDELARRLVIEWPEDVVNGFDGAELSYHFNGFWSLNPDGTSISYGGRTYRWGGVLPDGHLKFTWDITKKPASPVIRIPFAAKCGRGRNTELLRERGYKSTYMGPHFKLKHASFGSLAEVSETWIEAKDGTFAYCDVQEIGGAFEITIPQSFYDTAPLPWKLDPTTVATSTSATATAYSNQQKIRRFSNGVLFGMFHDGNGWLCRYSSDNGATWNAPGTGATIDSPFGNNGASVFIDPNDYIHVAMANSADVLYHRGTPDAAKTSYTWSAGVLISSTATHYPDIVAHAEGTGWKAHAVWAYANAQTTTRYQRIDITSGGVISLDGAMVTVGENLAVSGGSYPSVAVDSSKNLYVKWTTGQTGAGKGVRFKKATYSAGPTWTWGSEEAITEGEYAGHMGPCLLDSTGRVVVAFTGANTPNLFVWRRATGGTWSDISPTTVSSSSLSLTIDTSDNLYVFYVNGAANSGLLYRKYDGSAWSSAVTADSDTTSKYPSARRDTTGSAVDVLYTSGSASPYNVKHYRLELPSPITHQMML